MLTSIIRPTNVNRFKAMPIGISSSDKWDSSLSSSSALLLLPNNLSEISRSTNLMIHDGIEHVRNPKLVSIENHGRLTRLCRNQLVVSFRLAFMQWVEHVIGRTTIKVSFKVYAIAEYGQNRHPTGLYFIKNQNEKLSLKMQVAVQGGQTESTVQ